MASQAPRLTHSQLYGFKGDLSHNVHFLDDQSLVYPAAHSIVVHNTETKDDQFVVNKRGDDASVAAPEITALAVSPSKKYLAFAEKAERATILIYEVDSMRRRKQMATSECQSTQYVSLAFTNDDQTLLSLGGSPDFALIVWSWAHSKPAATVKLQLSVPTFGLSSRSLSVNGGGGGGGGGGGAGGGLQQRGSASGASLGVGGGSVGMSSLDPVDFRRRLQCSFCPMLQQIITVSTPKSLFLFQREIDGATETLEPLALDLGEYANTSTSYICHEWLDGQQVVVATGQGELLLFEDAKFRAALPPPPKADEQDLSASAAAVQAHADEDDVDLDGGASNAGADGGRGGGDLSEMMRRNRRRLTVTSLCRYSAGFLAGTSDGRLVMYEGSVDGSYTPARSFTVKSRIFDSPGAVRSIDLSISEEQAVLSMEDNQLYALSLYDSDIVRTEDVRLEPLLQSAHLGEITGMDTCVRKPLVATCGKDRTVRVWNIQERVLEKVKVFNETPLSVALHPSGLHLIVGFEEKLRLMNILMDDIRTFKVLPIKNCTEVQISHGGQCFAAVTGLLITVYDFYTCEQLYQSRDHNAPVHSICWRVDDAGIVSAGVEAVYERLLFAHGDRTQEVVERKITYTSAVASSQGPLYAVGDDSLLSEISGNQKGKVIPSEAVLTQLAISQPEERMLVAGTVTGVVRVYAFPLSGQKTDYVVHNSRITRVCITADDAFVVVADRDGCLSVFEVQERDSRRMDIVPYAQEVLATKSDLEEKESQMQSLRAQVDDLTVQNEYQLRMQDLNNQESIKELTDKYNLQLQHDKNRYDTLKIDKADMEQEYEEKMRRKEHGQEERLSAMDYKHQQDLMGEWKQYHDLEMVMQQEEEERTELRKERELNHQQELEHLRLRFSEQLESERSSCMRVQKEKDLVDRKFRETVNQLEEDTDKEVEMLKAKYEARLHKVRDETLRLQGENGIMNKKFSALQKDIEDQRDDMDAMDEHEHDLAADIAALNDEIAIYKEKIRSRDEQIGKNEEDIYELKKQNQELEKYKFVLDYRIKQLKQQIEPRQREIEDMNVKVMELDQQLEGCHAESRRLEAQNLELDKRKQEKQAGIRTQRQKTRGDEARLARVKHELELLVQRIQDPARLRSGAKKLIKAHARGTAASEAQLDPTVQDEYDRQLTFLESSVTALKRQAAKESNARKSATMRVMQENVALIKEINGMRREIQNLKQMNRRKQQAGFSAASRGPRSSRTRRRAASGHSSRMRGGTAGYEAEEAMDDEEAELVQLIGLQQQQIETLRDQVRQAQLGVGSPQSGLAQRPVSRERLPPVDNL